MTKKALKRKALTLFIILFLFLNVVAFFHAYQFTHFVNGNSEKTLSPTKLSTLGKIKTILFGVNNPRPVNTVLPNRAYKTVQLQSNKLIECWSITLANPKGTVVLFHGYGGNKSSLLDKSEAFLQQGYNTFLVDFMGSGGSEGNQTTIGYKEAEEVKTVFDYLKQKGEKKIFLFGTSLGAVAIMKAIHDYPIQPDGIIIECPFGSMYQTTCARFSTMHVPTFPMAGLLVFWGGVQNGFWVFGHQPVDYAKKIKCPTLLLYGEKDNKVSKAEIDEIFANLNGKKTIKIYKLAGHENFLHQYKQDWTVDTKTFLENN